MLIGLLNACIIRGFVESLASNLKRPIKLVSSNNRPCQARTTLLDISTNESFFIHLLSTLINVAEVVILLMIHKIDYVFQKK